MKYKKKQQRLRDRQAWWDNQLSGLGFSSTIRNSVIC